MAMAEAWSPHYPVSSALEHLAPWRDVLHAGEWPSLDSLNALARRRGVVNSAGRPISFGTQTVRCGQREYEDVILTNGVVPTRSANWHDLYNALTWLAFPRTKAALNAVQCAELERGPRGRVSDAATLFDESGLILAGPEWKVADLLRARRWREACWDQRSAWSRLRVRVIGHAILEKLRRPWPGITAKCLYVRLESGPGATEAALDEAVARVWTCGEIARPADLFPMPVLGVPGWWPANAQAEFYDNREVFREQVPAPMGGGDRGA